MELPKALQNLIYSLSMLQGVGEKSATRMALNILNWNEGERDQFSDSLRNLKNLTNCKSCNILADSEQCSICANPKREQSETLCIVENINDVLAIERSEQYFGLYHILGGVLNPLIGIGPSELFLETLEERVQQLGIKNIILAINPSVEGDASCSYIKDILPSELNIERIGFGIPMGGSLEYVDSMTISKAFENRKNL